MAKERETGCLSEFLCCWQPVGERPQVGSSSDFFRLAETWVFMYNLLNSDCLKT